MSIQPRSMFNSPVCFHWSSVRQSVATVLFVSIIQGLVAAKPVKAYDFVESTGHWTVVSLAESCLAVNRPLSEFNARPLVALAFSRAMTGDLKLQVFLWPGAVPAASAIDLQVTTGNSGNAVRLPSVAMHDMAIETSEPLSTEVIDRLASAELVVIAVGPSTPSLTFDIAQVGAVFDLLETCIEDLDDKAN